MFLVNSAAYLLLGILQFRYQGKIPYNIFILIISIISTINAGKVFDWLKTSKSEAHLLATPALPF